MLLSYFILSYPNELHLELRKEGDEKKKHQQNANSFYVECVVEHVPCELFSEIALAVKNYSS